MMAGTSASNIGTPVMSGPAAPFATRLHEAVFQKGTPAIVGLDPNWDEIPESLKQEYSRRFEDPLEARAEGTIAFCKRIVDVTAELVPAVKIQSAFFEMLGVAGPRAIAEVTAHARSAGLLVVLDAKRNDIGNTAAAYAAAYLGPSAGALAADALTINPYLGEEGLAPFVEQACLANAGLFVLVRTSNPGAGRLQDAEVAGKPVYEIVAEMVRESADRTAVDGNSLVGAVVGATAPKQLVRLRGLLPTSILLVPGYGSQGGGGQQCEPAFRADGTGAVINNSRGILYAFRRPEHCHRDWADAARCSLEDMRRDLNQYWNGGHG